MLNDLLRSVKQRISRSVATTHRSPSTATPRSNTPGLAWSLAAVAAVGILGLTLPSSAAIDPSFVYVCVVCGDGALADFAVNILLFVPLGAALVLTRSSLKRIVLLSLALSVGIEIAQLLIPGRYSSLADIAANTLGGLLGGSVPAIAGWWRRPDAARRTRLAALVPLIILIAAINGSLQTIETAIEPDFAHWHPEFGSYEPWTGRVLAASIGDLEVPPVRLRPADSVGQRLASGAPLQLRAVAGRPTERVAVIFALSDPTRQMTFLLGALEDHVIVRPRRRSNAWGLVATSVRFEHALAETREGAPLELRYRTRADGNCLRVNGRETCVPHRRIGGVWSAFYSPDTWSNATRVTLDLFVLALLALALASTARPLGSGWSIAALTVVGVGLLLASRSGAVAPFGGPDLLAILIGWGVGSWISRPTAAATPGS